MLASQKITFTLHGGLAGVRSALPLAASSFAYGVVWGVLARQAGLSALEGVLMSGLVFAGASQTVALQLWATPLPMVTLIITTLIVNLRHLLMGAALRPWFAHLRPLQAYSSVFLMADENWALTMRELRDGKNNGAFLLGSGLALMVAWLSATLIGTTLGAVIRDPARWGLDFVFTAVFVALLVGLWEGKRNIVPWLVAAVVALVAERWLGGKWYILIGGVAGSAVGAWRDAR